MELEQLFLKMRGRIDFVKEKIFGPKQLKNHILLKYLLKDLSLYFLVSFMFFFMIFFVNQILLTVEDLLAKSAPIHDVVRVMFYSFPFIIAQSAPYATLVGFLMSLGGMMSNNEILIFRSAGFSFFKLLIPVLFLGAVISIISFFVNDYLLPLGQKNYNKLIREISQSTPTIQLESNSSKQLGSSTIVMGKVEDNTVSDIILFDSSDAEEQIIVARNSTLGGIDEPGVLMQLNMSDAKILSIENKNRRNYDLMTAGKATLNIFDSQVLGTTTRYAREMTSTDLRKEIKNMKEENNGRVSGRIKIWLMEYHRKFSVPFGSLFFAFLAISVAFLFGKHNGQTLGLFLGIVICVLSWAMQIMGQLFVQKLGWHPFWSIWIPNFIVGIFAFGFFMVLIKK